MTVVIKYLLVCYNCKPIQYIYVYIYLLCNCVYIDYNIWICIEDINSWVVTLNFPCPARTVFAHLLQYRHALPMVHTFLMTLKNIWAHPSLQICVMKRILSPSLQTVLPHSDSRLVSMLMKPKSCLRPRQSKINRCHAVYIFRFFKDFIRIDFYLSRNHQPYRNIYSGKFLCRLLL